MYHHSIYNKSLETRTVSSASKRSNITPVHKGEDTNDPGNYCPISVLPILAKILKKIRNCFPVEFFFGVLPFVT